MSAYNFDECVVDLMEFNENVHLRLVYEPFIAFIGYFPATKRLYVCIQNGKTPHASVQSIKHMLQYLPSDQSLSQLISDDGNEFKGDVTAFCNENKIERCIRNPNASDYAQINAINGMCNYVRKQFYKALVKLAVKSPEIGDEAKFGKRQISLSVVECVFNSVLHEYNYVKENKTYGKPPCKVTEEDVIRHNRQVLIERGVWVPKKINKIGDVVRVQLLHGKIEKGRHQKWSDGTYQIIDYQSPYYLLVPRPYSWNDYAHAFKINTKQGISKPVYFRRQFQVKDAEAESNDYYEYEMEDTQQYIFDRIIAHLPESPLNMENYKQFIQNKKSKYVVEVNIGVMDEDFDNGVGVQRFMATPAQMREFNKERPCDAELEYWFGIAPQDGKLYSYQSGRTIKLL